MFPRSPEHAVVFPIIPEAVSVVVLAGTVAFWCHFALKSDLLTGLLGLMDRDTDYQLKQDDVYDV